MYLNKIKYQRAIADCGKDATEDQIKERYLKLGGVLEIVEEVIEVKAVEVVEEPKESIIKKVVKKVVKKVSKK